MLKYLLIITINFIIYIETKNLKKSKKNIYIYFVKLSHALQELTKS